MRIFVSYRHVDNEYLVREVAKHLSAEFGKDNVFLDLDSIPLGADFPSRIRAALETVDVVLMMKGDKWESERLHESNDFVRHELLEAERLRKTIVPVLHSGSSMPEDAQLPRELVWLSTRQAFRMGPAKNLASDLERLTFELRALEKQERGQHNISPKSKPAVPHHGKGVPGPQGLARRGTSKQESAQPGLGPLLVIGCGGSGVRALQYARRELTEVLLRAGGIDRIPRAWQFIALDTEEPARFGVTVDNVPQTDFVNLAPSGDLDDWIREFAGRLSREGRLPGFGSTHPGFSASELGAGHVARGSRRVGRLTGLQAEQVLIDRLNQALGECRLGASELEGLSLLKAGHRINPAIRVVVVSSLSGGTGSSILLDVCDIVSSLLPGLERLDLLLAPGSGLSNDQEHKLNALATLSEIMVRSARGATPTINPLVIEGDSAAPVDERQGTWSRSISGLIVSFCVDPLSPKRLASLVASSKGRGDEEPQLRSMVTDQVLQVCRPVVIQTGVAEFTDYCKSRVLAEVRSYLLGDEAPPTGDERGGSVSVNSALVRLRKIFGLPKEKTLPWGWRRIETPLLAADGAVETPVKRWLDEATTDLLAFADPLHASASGKLTERVQAVVGALVIDVGELLDADVERYCDSVSRGVRSFVRDVVGAVTLPTVRRYLGRVMDELQEAANVLRLDAQECDWRRQRELSEVMTIVESQLAGSPSESAIRDSGVLTRILEIEAWGRVSALRANRSASILAAAAREVLEPLRLQLESWEAVLAVEVPGLSSETWRVPEGVVSLVSPKDWPKLFEMLEGSTPAARLLGAVNRQNQYSSLPPFHRSMLATRLVANLHLGRFEPWLAGRKAHFAVGTEQALDRAASVALRIPESPVHVLTSKYPGRTHADKPQQVAELGPVGKRLASFFELRRLLALGHEPAARGLINSVVLGVDPTAISEEAHPVGIVDVDPESLALLTVEKKSWPQIAGLGAWISSLETGTQSGLSAQWRQARVRSVTECLPVSTRTLRAIVRGWAVGLMLGDIQKGGSERPWRIMPDDQSATMTSFPSVAGVYDDASPLESLLPVLEQMPLAHAGVFGSGGLAPYRRLARLGEQAPERLMNWILNGSGPADRPVTTGLFGDDPTVRLVSSLVFLEVAFSLCDDRRDGSDAFGADDYKLLAATLRELIMEISKGSGSGSN